MGCEGCESEKPVTRVHQAKVRMTSCLIWETMLTRIDSLEEEAFVRPTIGRHVIRNICERWRHQMQSLQRPVHTIRVIPKRGIRHLELRSEDDVAAPAAKAPSVPFLSYGGRRVPGALVVDMTQADQ